MSEANEEAAVEVDAVDGAAAPADDKGGSAGKPRQLSKEAKWEITDREARSIIDSEAEARRRKTEKLQASRLARDRKERLVAAKKGAATKKSTSKRTPASKAAK